MLIFMTPISLFENRCIQDTAPVSSTVNYFVEAIESRLID